MVLQWAQALCAVVDVQDCTQDMSGKEMWADSCALSIFRGLTKEVHDGATPCPGELLASTCGQAFGSSFESLVGRSLQTGYEPAGHFWWLQSILCIHPAHD